MSYLWEDEIVGLPAGWLGAKHNKCGSKDDHNDDNIPRRACGACPGLTLLYYPPETHKHAWLIREGGDGGGLDRDMIHAAN